MRTQTTAPEAINALLEQQERSHAWLARETGIRYKRVLAEVKHATSPLSLFHAALIADALNVDLDRLVSENRKSVAA